MPDSVYVLDANVLIEAKRRYYAFDLAPAFWDRLIDFAEKGQIESIDRIKGELDKGKDELTEWANNYFSDAFKSTDKDEIIQSYASIMNWVNQGEFSNAAKSVFANCADGWLVAHAIIKRCVVVTEEVMKPKNYKIKVQIPNICKEFNVPCVDTFEMLRRLGVQWLH